MGERVRIGGHVDLATVEKVLGFQPEVGETFEVEGILMRVLTRTLGIRETEDDEEWFDWLFVATVGDVDDADEMVRRVKEAFGFEADEDEDEDESEDDEDGDRAEDESRGEVGEVAGDAEAEAVADDDAADGDGPAGDESDGPRRLGLGDRVLREIEDILRAA